MTDPITETLPEPGALPVKPQTSPVRPIKWRKLFSFFILGLAILLLLFYGTRRNALKPSPVSAAEIIQRNLEKFIKLNTIYHQKTKQYLEGSNIPNVYEIWEDEDQKDTTFQRFYNEVTYADGKKVIQGFDLNLHWDIDYKDRTVHKDIYVYNNPSGPQPMGRRVDIAEQFDELLKNGILEVKEGKVGEREVYVVYDTRTSPDKHWDILTFDKNNFQILQTEKYGEDKRLEEVIVYEIQEAIERTDESLAKYFTYKDPGQDFAVYQRNFYTMAAEQEEYILVSGTPQEPQTTGPVSSTALETPGPDLTPAPRNPNPPIIEITFPTEMQVVEFTRPDQRFCLVDVPAGGDTSGLERKHNINDGGWASYVDHFTLCFDPKEGINRVSLQYKNKFGDESVVYTRQFNFHK